MELGAMRKKTDRQTPRESRQPGMTRVTSEPQDLPGAVPESGIWTPASRLVAQAVVATLGIVCVSAALGVAWPLIAGCSLWLGVFWTLFALQAVFFTALIAVAIVNLCGPKGKVTGLVWYLRSWYRYGRMWQPYGVLPRLCGCVGVFVALLSFVLFIMVAATAHQAAPVREFQLEIPKVQSRVTVEWDDNDVVHIIGDGLFSQHDVYFAQGYVHALERLWQIDFLRNVASGSLSSILGSAAVESDQWLRTWGFRHYAEQDLAMVRPEFLELTQAYVDGINEYMASPDRATPIEFLLAGYEPQNFTVVDVMAYTKVLLADISGNVITEMRREDLLLRGVSRQRVLDLYGHLPDWVPTQLRKEDEPGAFASDEFRARSVGADVMIDDVDVDVDKDGNTMLGRTLHKAETLLRERLDQRAATASPADQRRYRSRRSLWGRYGMLTPRQDASNGFAVHGNHTKSGKPVLANDPHLSLRSPSIWMLMHLEDGRADPHLNVIGASAPGLPGIAIGRNHHLAWGITSAVLDSQDVYRMQEINATHYLHDGSAKGYQYRDEVIKVKGGDDELWRVKYSVYGPDVAPLLLDDAYTGTYCMRWTGHNGTDTTLNALFALNRAENYAEFLAGAEEVVSTGLNFIYADTAGNIAMVIAGHLPARASGHDGTMPVNGTGEYDWQGIVAWSQMPRVLNPQEGFIASANQWVLPNGTLTYKYPINSPYDFATGHRGARIRDELLRLTARGDITVQDIAALQTDVVSGLWTRSLRQVMERFVDDLDGLYKVWATSMVEDWDGSMLGTSREATLMWAWWSEFFSMAKEETGEPDDGYWWQTEYLENALLTGTDSNCPDNDCNALARDNFVKAFNRLGDGFAALRGPSRFDDHKRAVQVHPLLGADALPTGISCAFNKKIFAQGDEYCVAASSIRGSKLVDDSLNPMVIESNYGASYREVVDLGDLERSLFILPLGNPGDQFDHRYNGMMAKFYAGEYLDMKTADYPVRISSTLDRKPFKATTSSS